MRPTPGITAALALFALLSAACVTGGNTDTDESGDDRATPTAAVGGAEPAGADTARSETSARHVTVVGVGRATSASDLARVVVGVEVTRDDVRTAFDDASAAMNDVTEALRAEGVDDADLRTDDLSVRERRDDRRPPPDEPVEEAPETAEPETVVDVVYVVANVVEVTIRDVDRAGELIAVAVEAGGDDARVQRFRLAVDDETEVLDEARAAAFGDAQARAEQYADLAGRELGTLVSVSEVIGTPGPTATPEPVEVADDAAAPPVEPGEQETEVRIQAIWELE